MAPRRYSYVLFLVVFLVGVLNNQLGTTGRLQNLYHGFLLDYKTSATSRTSSVFLHKDDSSGDNASMEQLAINRTIDSLRIVAFGTSKTFEPEGYVKMLSPTALNLGLRATHADYPSLCVYSLIGDNIYDVIIIEFPASSGDFHANFERLVKRLRARFPTTILIYLNIPQPLHDVLYHDKYLYDYIRSLNLKSKDEPAFQETIRNITMDLTWTPTHNDPAYSQTIQGAGGHSIVFPPIHKRIDDFILENAKYFGTENFPWDFVHPTALGHEIIAAKIRQLLANVISKRPLEVSTSVVGEWLGQDACISWFTDTHLAKDVQVTNMTLATGRMAGYERGEKWALEVDRDGGTMVVDSSKYSTCHIYLAYMAMGPRKIYPRVVVSINNDTVKNFHLRKVMYIGTVNDTARVTLTVTPIPEDAHSSKGRFRITGIILTPFYATMT